jgi:chromate transporter
LNAEPPAAFPTFAEALRVWFRIGCLSFGGPAGQIALMHREVVDGAAGCPTRASSTR